MIPTVSDADSHRQLVRFIDKNSVTLRGLVVTGTHGTAPVPPKKILPRGKPWNIPEARPFVVDLLNTDQPPLAILYLDARRSDWQPCQLNALRQVVSAADHFAFHLYLRRCLVQPDKVSIQIASQGTGASVEYRQTLSDSRG